MAGRSVNKVILVGRLGKDAEGKFTPSGVHVCNFSVATERRWKDTQSGEWKSETDWHNVQLWRSENLTPYLLKGTQLYVEGRLQTRSYEDKDGQKRYVTEVVADEVVLLGGKPGGGDSDGGGGQGGGMASRPRTGANAHAQSRPTAAQSGQPGWSGVSDDDVPF